MSTFKASLSKGRSGWCVIFRHPLLDGTAGQKRRVRRGLGTRDEAEAARLVGQMNEILSSPDLWSATQREKLEARYDQKIVGAFLDGIEPERYDPWADRERVIPLPGEQDGFAKLQAVGTTGSGKTTAIRQLLGTDPERERFPSTSAAKTTICDIEIVMAGPDFRAAVSFLPKDQVRQLIADCVAAAAFSFLENGPEGEAERRLLEHAEQKFRLNYVLGHVRTSSLSNRTEDIEDDDAPPLVSDGDAIPPSEIEKMAAFLQRCLSDIRNTAERLSRAVEEGLGQKVSDLTVADKDAFEELAEAEILKDDGYHELVDRILDEVEARFEGLGSGELTKGRDGWPLLWTWKCADRHDFISTVNRFSSNYAPQFGRLLTPLVQGMRVQGPFSPTWNDGSIPKLVLLDGQGIGHTADSTSSISTSITKRFKIADLILLVDNAAQPMQAASQAVLNSVVASGHAQKLIVCFTHFDEVRGDNLHNLPARRSHVVGSFENAIRAIGKSLGREAENGLRKLIPERLLFLSKIQEPLSPKNTLSSGSLKTLLGYATKSIQPPEPTEFRPVYDVANLIIAIQRATQQFHTKWGAKLGFASTGIESPEPWQRIKALTRRIAHFNADEYDGLQPVADLVKLLQEEISRYLANPLRWLPTAPTQEHLEESQRALDAIRQNVFTMLHDFSTARLVQGHIADWVKAYDHRGFGSTRLRAKDIRALYEVSAPVPSEMPGPDANVFMLDVRSLVRDAIRASGGSVVGWDATGA